MTRTRINWFELPARDLERASRFYSATLNASMIDMESPAGVIKAFTDGETPVGALVAGAQNAPAQTGALIYFGTDDIAGVLERIAENGGEVVLPRTSIGAFGHIAQFIDSEGNRVALHSA